MHGESLGDGWQKVKEARPIMAKLQTSAKTMEQRAKERIS
jgi:hypothetical protein